ncbi:MAG: OmpA family protein [Pseudomonadota bacterium]
MNALRFFLACSLVGFVQTPVAAQTMAQMGDVPLECRVLHSLNQAMPKACKRVVKAEPMAQGTHETGTHMPKVKGAQTPVQPTHDNSGHLAAVGAQMHQRAMTDPMVTGQGHVAGAALHHTPKPHMTMQAQGMMQDAAGQTVGPGIQPSNGMTASIMVPQLAPMALGTGTDQRQAYQATPSAPMYNGVLQTVLAQPLPPDPTKLTPETSVGGPLSLEFTRSTVLTAEARVALNQLAREILGSASQPMCLLIEGHADSVGAESQNLAVSQRRAEHVRNLLMADIGTQNFRFIVRGAGESRPSPGLTPQDPRNRRVEIYGRVGFDACV